MYFATLKIGNHATVITFNADSRDVATRLIHSAIGTDVAGEEVVIVKLSHSYGDAADHAREDRKRGIRPQRHDKEHGSYFW